MYFEYLIGKGNFQVNAVREVCHKAQPQYKSHTRRISYKVFDLDQFIDALGETSVTLDTEVLFSGNTVCEEEAAPLSAEEEIARAKARVNAGQKRKRPSSKSTLTVGYGEGRATREIELIWWPDLYSLTQHGNMALRMFIEKCEF